MINVNVAIVAITPEQIAMIYKVFRIYSQKTIVEHEETIKMNELLNKIYEAAKN